MGAALSGSFQNLVHTFIRTSDDDLTRSVDVAHVHRILVRICRFDQCGYLFLRQPDYGCETVAFGVKFYHALITLLDEPNSIAKIQSAGRSCGGKGSDGHARDCSRLYTSCDESASHRDAGGKQSELDRNR